MNQNGNLVCKLGEITLELKQGDIINEICDAIICPANSFGYMRGGLAQSIRIAGGDIIEEQAKNKAPISLGDAVITSGGSLKVKFIIHAPTMALPMGPATKENVSKAIMASFTCAANHGLQSLALPAMGTGTGWLPYVDSAQCAVEQLETFSRNAKGVKRVIIVAHSSAYYNAVVSSLKRHELCGSP